MSRSIGKSLVRGAQHEIRLYLLVQQRGDLLCCCSKEDSHCFDLYSFSVWFSLIMVTDQIKQLYQARHPGRAHGSGAQMQGSCICAHPGVPECPQPGHSATEPRADTQGALYSSAKPAYRDHLGSLHICLDSKKDLTVLTLSVIYCSSVSLIMFTNSIGLPSQRERKREIFCHSPSLQFFLLAPSDQKLISVSLNVFNLRHFGHEILPSCS